MFSSLAMPGVEADPANDLVAIWRSKKGERFQNYRAKFTILDTGTVSREWITSPFFHYFEPAALEPSSCLPRAAQSACAWTATGAGPMD